MTTDEIRAHRAELIRLVEGVQEEMHAFVSEAEKREQAAAEDTATRARRFKIAMGVLAAVLVMALVAIVLQWRFSARIEQTNDRLEATTSRLERSVKEQCAFLALALGSYNPSSRAPEDREQYEDGFRRMRASFAALDCTNPLIPPATAAPKPRAFGPLDGVLAPPVPVAMVQPLPAQPGSPRVRVTVRNPSASRSSSSSSTSESGGPTRVVPKLKLPRIVPKVKVESDVKVGPLKTKVRLRIP